jgi:NAD(P)-dependent dehydrogenase (short-subunit alcohol dehydrogenase family)
MIRDQSKIKKYVITTKIALVTGASGNLGSAVVKKFLSERYAVIGIVHKKKEADTASENYEEIELDLLNEGDCEKAINGIIEKYGTIDVAVLTAGGFAMGGIEDTKIKNITDQFQLNFVTAYNIARPLFLQMMKENKGRIFLTGSKQGADTALAKGVVAYGLSKSLLFNLAQIFNAESAGKNVVTTMIVPGIIDTQENRKSMPGSDFSKWTTPEQIAEAISFYSSEKALVIREPVIKLYNNL